MIKICIPSYKRCNKVDTIKNLKGVPFDFIIFVNDIQEKIEYEKYNDCEIVVSNKEGITKNRNFILGHFKENEKIVTMCDDVEGLYKLDELNNCLNKMNIDDVYKFINEGFECCEKENTKLWGVYPTPNHFFMSNKTTKKQFIIGTFSGIIISEIRHDERLILKEDYDFTIKHIKKYGSVVRFNNFAIKAKHYSNKGGCVDYRNAENEQKSIKILQELYPGIVRFNTKRKNEILLHFSKDVEKYNNEFF